MSDLVDVLAIGAHPDDVELFCGGTLAVLADRGYRVGVVDLTRGERATHGTVEVRAAEAEAAAAVLGLAFRENLGLPDGLLDASARSPHVGPVVAAIRRRRPEIVLAPWTEERHPDHVAAGELAVRAVFLAALEKHGTEPPLPRHAPRALLHYEMRHRMVPSFVVDTSAAWERKLRAIRCHASQLGVSGTPTLIGSPRALEALEARDRYRGSQIGTNHGEALRLGSVLGTSDPLALLRAAPGGAPHAFEDPR